MLSRKLFLRGTLTPQPPYCELIFYSPHTSHRETYYPDAFLTGKYAAAYLVKCLRAETLLLHRHPSRKKPLDKLSRMGVCVRLVEARVSGSMDIFSIHVILNAIKISYLHGDWVIRTMTLLTHAINCWLDGYIALKISIWIL